MVDVGPLTPRPRALDLPAELTDDDRAWVRSAMIAVGVDVVFEQDRSGVRPVADTSWLKTEKIRG